MVDPDGDGDNKDYYEIQINPQNLVFDSQFDDYNTPKKEPDGPFGHQEWSAKLKSAVTIDGTLDKADDKDTATSSKPRFRGSPSTRRRRRRPKSGRRWRMNFYAMENNGGVAWSPILGQGNFHRASRFGRVTWAVKGWTPPPARCDARPHPQEAARPRRQRPDRVAHPQCRRAPRPQLRRAAGGAAAAQQRVALAETSCDKAQRRRRAPAD